MPRPRTIPPPDARSASTVSLAERDADAYAGHLLELREELQDPPEFVLWTELLPVVADRDRPVRDGVAPWLV